MKRVEFREKNLIHIVPPPVSRRQGSRLQGKGVMDFAHHRSRAYGNPGHSPLRPREAPSLKAGGRSAAQGEP
jgi:hypothetical protein